MNPLPNPKRRPRFIGDERRNIYRAWLNGKTYAELAKTHATHRETMRALVLSFMPSLEDFRRHDYHRRTRVFHQQRRRTHHSHHSTRPSGPNNRH